MYCSLPVFHPLVTKHDKYCSSIPVDCVCRVSCCPFTGQAEECIQIHTVIRTTSQSAKSPRKSFVLAPRALKLAQIRMSFRDGLEAAFHSLSFSTSFVSTWDDKNRIINRIIIPRSLRWFVPTRHTTSSFMTGGASDAGVDSLTLAFSRFQFGSG